MIFPASGPRPASRSLVALCAVAAPALLLAYGLCRLADGADGTRGPGLAWNVGHALFFLAFVLLAALIVGLRRLLPAVAPWRRVPANVAVAAGLAGSLCFLWVILGDLFPRLDDDAPLPGPLNVAGPVLFQLGMLGLLVQLVATRPRRLPWWSPVLVLAGFVLIGADLDLLPIAAVVVLGGLSPLVRRREGGVRAPNPRPDRQRQGT